ncbi:arginine N-succinyltransferase [Sphingoaurantiacus capsulatus]|uniref:Arginine N-succinyltransferase n=1 Tax=Sphingoaurantiacus capsulatus TaxID=1771310 RepID=A0ABV7X8B3_9SPHN
MSWFVRPAREDDLDALLDLAKMTGGGFTNLPPNRDALAKRLAWSSDSYAKAVETPDNELYMLFLEEAETGRIGGTACLFSRVGVEWPFYSYKLGMVTQSSRELKRTFAMQTLYLVNDYDGASEVGGLFLHPELRVAGLGRLLARSRYLFMAQHRERFGERVLAELRGFITAEGGSPFWDGLGAKFFGMPFQEADHFNSLHGNQFIADLMPKHPIYVSMLPDSAREVIGHPHPSGIPAKKLLEAEGFAFDGYVDIFDGGPTMCSRVENVRTVRDSRSAAVGELTESAGGLLPALLATGRLGDFRAWMGHSDWCADGLVLPADDARLHGLQIGDLVRHAPA